MALAKRIIPTFLYRGTTLVKGVGFNSWRSVGNVIQAARIYAARGVDELCIFDINATPVGEGPNYGLIEKICQKNFTPITIGGGIRTLGEVQKVLDFGADKVAICAAARSTPDLIDQIAARYGGQVLCAVVEFRECMTNSEVLAVATSYADRGAGEIMLQSIERDGTMEGYRLNLIEDVCDKVDVPIIVSGGCAGYNDMYEAIIAGADAVAAGALYQFTDCTPRGAAEYLSDKGICVRL